MFEATGEVITTAGATGGAVWVAVRMALRALYAEIADAHKKADHAHVRIDTILMAKFGELNK